MSTWIKYWKLNVFCKERLILCIYVLLEQHLKHDNDELIQFHSMYNTVLALLQNLQLENSMRLIINDHTSAFVKDLYEYFTQLNISWMSFTQNNYNIIIMIVSNKKKIVLVSLTFFKLTSFTTDLTAHLFHMLQLQSSQSLFSEFFSARQLQSDMSNKIWIADVRSLS